MKGSLLVAGTTSDAGKSVFTTGLCRLLARQGVRVAPFKAQNMSNNSMVVAGPDGAGVEIGHAQWIQAMAAGVPAEVAMNPVLLKPGSDRRSHVVLNGRPAGSISSAQFAGDRRALARAAFASYADLAGRFDVVICEGAGSPTEINLRANDYVNMGLARYARMPVVVVGDIDRGGLYAALYGTVALLEPDDQRLVAGFVVTPAGPCSASAAASRCSDRGWRTRTPSQLRFDEARQQRLDHVADLIERHIDTEALMGLIGAGPPAGLPVLPTGVP